MTKPELQKRITWAEEHIERIIADTRTDRQKYKNRTDEGRESGLKLALFILRCYLQPDHPDVLRVETERKRETVSS